MKRDHDSPRQTITDWITQADTDRHPLISKLRTLVRLIVITATEFQKNDLSLRSGALTYTILLSLVPILAMSTAVVKGLGGGNQLRQAAYTYIDTLERQNDVIDVHLHTGEKLTTATPEEDKPSLTGHLRSAADKLFDYVDKTNFATLGTIGVLGILVSVILVLSNIETAMNTIWKVAAGRSVMRKVADYLTLLIFFPLSINVAFAASAFLKNPSLASKMDMVIPLEWLQDLLLKPLPILVFTFTFYIMYIFFPNTRVKTVPAICGAGLAALLWFIMQDIYITLQVGVANYNAIYGSFATLPLFLVWVYFSWIFILAGAQLAYAFQHIKTYQFADITDSPAVRLACAFDIMTLLHNGFDNNLPLHSDDITDRLPVYPQATTKQVLTVLLDAKMVHMSTGDDRLLPAASREQLDQQAMVRLILGSDAPATRGGQQSNTLIEAAAQLKY